MALENIKCSEIGLPYELSYIPEELQRRAKSELFEDEETRVHGLRDLRSMIKDEMGLEWDYDDLFLLSYLRARKFNVKRAFQLVKTSYIVRGKHDELYKNFNYAAVKKTLEENSIGFLPYRDSEGCVILYLRISKWNIQASTLGDCFRALTCALLHANLFPATQIAGFKVILDVAGLTTKHLPHITPSYLFLLAQVLQNCFPGRFKGVHLLNLNYIFSTLWTIFKPFVSTKLKERIHLHGKNLKKLHKYVSPSLLPAELEGELPPFDNTEWRNKMEEKADFFALVLSHGYGKYKEKTLGKK